MLPDSPSPQNDDKPSHIFAETRASTLAKNPIAPEILEESAAPQTQTEATEDAPESKTQPAPENPTLALSFAPAPDAPFQSSVTIGIQCQTPGAAIYYTLDGTQPDPTSTPFTPEKILLTQSATLSARAFDGDQSGPLQSADYVVSKPLWQENEPADQTDPTLHRVSENLSAPDAWKTSAASVRGKLHAHRALWREDSFALGNVENRDGVWSIGIVSDGAGSAPLSRVGSRLACERAMESLRAGLGTIETLSDDINADLPRVKSALVGAATAALQNLRDEADKRGQPLGAFAATLLILVRRAWQDSQLCAALQVGDGAIALDCESGLKMLGAADHGQHSSETRFLTTADMEADLGNRVKFSLPNDLRATLIVSDGVSDDYFPEDKRLAEVFEAVKPLAQSADDAGVALLQWLGYEKKGSSDDRTLVLSWPAATDAVAELEAELDSAPPAPSPSETQAGLAPPSNPGVGADTRLEEGASPAVSAPDMTSATPESLEIEDLSPAEAETLSLDAGIISPTETRDGS